MRPHAPSASSVTGQLSLAVTVSPWVVASPVTVTTVASASTDCRLPSACISRTTPPWGTVVVEGSTAGALQSHGYPVTLMSPLATVPPSRSRSRRHQQGANSTRRSRCRHWCPKFRLVTVIATLLGGDAPVQAGTTPSAAGIVYAPAVCHVGRLEIVRRPNHLSHLTWATHPVPPWCR